jgi:hypothetical protein
MENPGSGGAVIVRVLRARVRASKVGAFNALFRGQVTLLREQPGLVYVKLARRLHADGSEEAVLFEEWEDAASLYRWVGPNLNEPRLVPGSRELIDDILVSHYEALDMHPDDPSAENEVFEPSRAPDGPEEEPPAFG